MKKLTARQKAILSFIEQYWEDHSISPSYREIQHHFSFKSPNAVTKHLTALKQKRVITLKKNGGFTKARSIIPLIKKSNDVPLVGKIVAGTPVESIENIEECLSLHSLGIDNSKQDHFALQVTGDSMINAHILDGDIAVIKKQPEVFEKEVAAILLDGEATLKYVKKRGDTIKLIPANDSMEAIVLDIYQAKHFSILGRVVMVFRKLLQ